MIEMNPDAAAEIIAGTAASEQEAAAEMVQMMASNPEGAVELCADIAEANPAAATAQTILKQLLNKQLKQPRMAEVAPAAAGAAAEVMAELAPDQAGDAAMAMQEAAEAAAAIAGGGTKS